MADIRSLVSQIPMEPGYVPAPAQPDLTVIQRLMGLPQTLRAVGQNLAVGAASLPYGIYQGFGNTAAGEAAMSQFQQEYGYTPTNPAAQRQLQGLGEFFQQLETEYKIPPIMAPVAATPAMGIRGMVPQTERLARELVSEIQTTPPTGAVQLAPTPGLLEKSDIGFYSQLEAAVQPLQNKGTGQQYLAQIQKSAGVKPEEIQWTGLDEFLKGKQSVTKQEIQDYLQANRVDVQEVRLSDEIDPDEVYRFMEDEAGEGYSYAEALDMLRDYGGESTKFSQYTLPGGENYREILLTLPAKQLTEAEARSVLGAAPDARLSQADIDFASRKQMQDYRSSHFDQPNILAHLRVNDRTVDGKKTLFVEEIQSDWHQAGRKRGYKTKESLESWYNQNKLDSDPPFADLDREQIRIVEQNRGAGMGGDTSVPDAPFKTSWHELSLKRAIQEAAEKGYDQIAFTTGKTQAERYDLSKQVRSIDWQESDRSGATKLVSIEPYNGNTIELPIDSNGVVLRSTGSQFDGKRVDEVVGKEVAEKIMGGNNGSLSGSGLQVGGEGMKGFYDNILPKSLDKLGKKFGAKVGKTDMDGVEVWQMDITPQMRESVTTKGQPLFAIPAIGAGLLGAGMMQEEETY